jgi:ABC-type dipeptide/oligopeptide/nickel transport system permease subunit
MTAQPSELALTAPAAAVTQAESDGFGQPSRSQARQALRRYSRSYAAMTATVVFVVIIVFSYAYPYFYRWKYNSGDLNALSVAPGEQGHILGTDETGFDLVARMMRGTQRDFIMMVVSTFIALFLGLAVGSIAGYFGRLWDNILMRIVDVMLTVPALVILIIACDKFAIANTAPGIGVIFGLFGWMPLSRLVRAQLLSLKEREFVEAAHAMGASNLRIITRHLIPNVLSTILVFATLFAATSIVAETSVTYLGYGVKPPDTSLGLLISRGVDAADTRPWLFYYPGVLVLVIVLAVNLIGEGIRNSFDPRHNRVRD